MARKRKKYLDDKFRINDEVEREEHNSRENNFFKYLGGFLTTASSTIFGVSLVMVTTLENYFLSGMGAFGLIAGSVVSVGIYLDTKKTKAKLKELKKIQNKEKLLIAEKTETKQLPSLEYTVLPK